MVQILKEYPHLLSKVHESYKGAKWWAVWEVADNAWDCIQMTNVEAYKAFPKAISMYCPT